MKDAIGPNEPFTCCRSTEVSKYDPDPRVGFSERHRVPS